MPQKQEAHCPNHPAEQRTHRGISQKEEAHCPNHPAWQMTQRGISQEEEANCSNHHPGKRTPSGVEPLPDAYSLRIRPDINIKGNRNTQQGHRQGTAIHATADSSERQAVKEATSKHVLSRRRGAILPNVKETDEKTKVERWLAKTVETAEYVLDRRLTNECEKQEFLPKRITLDKKGLCGSNQQHKTLRKKYNVNNKETVQINYKSSVAECQINKNVQKNLSKGDSVKKRNISSSDKLPNLGALRQIVHRPTSKSEIQVHYPVDGSPSHHADDSEPSNIGGVQLYTVLSMQQYNKSNLRKGLRVPPTQETKTHKGFRDQPRETNSVCDPANQVKPCAIHCQRNELKTDAIAGSRKQWGHLPSEQRIKHRQFDQPTEELECSAQQKTTELCNNTRFGNRKQYRLVSEFGTHNNHPLPRYPFISQLEYRTPIDQTYISNPAHLHRIYPYGYQAQRTDNYEDQIDDHMRDNYPQVRIIRRHREMTSEDQYQPEKQPNMSIDQFQHPAYIPRKHFQRECHVRGLGSQCQYRPSPCFEDVRQPFQVFKMSQSAKLGQPYSQTNNTIYPKETSAPKCNSNDRLHQTNLKELNVHASDTDTLVDMPFSEQYGNIRLSSEDLPNSHFGVPIPMITMTPASPQPASTPLL